jgi:hypothetical protein
VAQPSEPPTDEPVVALSRPQENLPPLADRVEERLDDGIGVLHVFGTKLIGPLWMTLFESMQDAIALGLLVKIPNFLSQWVLGKQFSGLDVCWHRTNIWSVDRYACFAIVLSDYTLWGVLIPRILYRSYRDLKNLKQKDKGSGHG